VRQVLRAGGFILLVLGTGAAVMAILGVVVIALAEISLRFPEIPFELGAMAVWLLIAIGLLCIAAWDYAKACEKHDD
jgi:formate hydrogenlyase subunit 3/multisubunit Na+/H+ antiporter MnhD subunit